MRAILVVLVAGMVAAAQAQFTFSVDDVLDDGFFNNPTSTRVDRSGVVHTVFMKQFDTDSSTKEIWYGNNAAGSWTFTRITNNAVREEFPALHLDDADNVHIAFHTGVTTTNKIRYVNNVGGSFGEIRDITGPGFVVVEFDIDSQGTVHFVFESQPAFPARSDIFYTTWSPMSGTGPLVNISNTATTSEARPFIRLGPDDVAHVVYFTNLLGGALVYQNNRSGAFAPVNTGIAGSVQDPIPVVDRTGRVSIFYCQGDILYVTDDAGSGTFGPAEPLLVGAWRPAFIEGAVVDPLGRRYIGFASNSGQRGVYFLAETSSGFSAPVEILASDATNLGASVSINDHGRLALTFQTGGVRDGNVFAKIFVASTQVYGDMNCDGVISVGDINGFVLALTDPDGYAAAFPDCDAARADLTFDGNVSVADINPFVDALVGS